MKKEEVGETIQAAIQRGRRALSEHGSKQILSAYGIPVTNEALVDTEEAAVKAAKRFGYPAVVKACGSELMHKSDRGLIALNLSDAAAVRAAVQDIGRRTGGDQFEGFLVQPMVRGKREVIVGALRDPFFGPCVMLGLGGIWVEALADVAFRLAPLEQRDALEMMMEIRGSAIFHELRGEPAVDRQMVSEVLISAGKILLDHPDIDQIDINPLIFDGAQPVAADALITLVPARAGRKGTAV